MARADNKGEQTSKDIYSSTKDFNLLKDIKKNKLYKASGDRDKKARQIIESYKKSDKNAIISKNNITPGQLVTFKYLAPKTKDELDYYDASPCSIFFGIFNSSLGKRVLAFNIHYFPPAVRYRIMNRIYEMYKPIYRKYFANGLNKELDGFDYQYIMDALDKYNLTFAVRMYIPSLIGDTCIVPPKLWSTAVFTEGWFKKETRSRIMQFFQKDAVKNHKLAGVRKRKKRKTK